jgi:PIN domain nuclease of toxin-antitoxin system
MLNLDTHILIYALSGEVTATERKILAKNRWSISGIVLWEVFKLRQLGRIQLDVSDFDFQVALEKVHVWPIDIHVFKALSQLDFRNDPVDEIIAATSVAFKVPLMTRDQKIRKSKIVPFA